MADRGHVHVATRHLGSGPVAPNVQVHRIGDVRSYRKLGPGPTLWKLLRVDPALGLLLRKLLRSQPFDVIHARHFEGPMVSAAVRVGLDVPLVLDAHTLLMSELPYYSLGPPASAKAGLGRWMDPDKISVVSNGTEVDHFDPASVKRSGPAGGKTLIFTGNLAEYQGIDLLLKAFRLVVSRIADARLVIATDSSFAPYEVLARELGIRDRIDLVASPAFADPPGFLANADVAINPRTNCDGVPVKLLNYMAAARPVVSFDSAAPGVRHNRTGWLVESGNVEVFADGIVGLLQDSRRADDIGRAARDYVVEFCSWPKAAERCEVLYR